MDKQKTLKSLIPLRNGMNEKNRRAVIDILNHQLADHYVLMTKTRFYHWNVEGPEFHDLHELFDQQYTILAEMVDEIAEQALKLGGQAAGTLSWFKSNARLPEDAGDTIPTTREMLQNLLDDHEAIMTLLHTDIKKSDDEYDDSVTSDMLVEMSEQHHRMAWMLRMLLRPSTLTEETVLDARGMVVNPA